ncbi:MAG: hypothetical protein NUW21_01970, partial [Elusimicrobia bacterium]|nr:hypothetical protein [Elusimicrobiota bacterium]
EARGKRAASAPPPDDAAQRSRELGEARRREIAMEVSGYLTPPPRTATPAPAAATPVPSAAEPPRAPLTSPAPLPSMFRWDEELRLLLYVAISVLLLAAAVSGVVLYQG